MTLRRRLMKKIAFATLLLHTIAWFPFTLRKHFSPENVQAFSGDTPANRVELFVSETAGMRRFGYPVNARVPFPKSALPSPETVRLLRHGEEVAAQVGAEARWDDGSVQWLTIDFNSSPAPLEREEYSVEYGPEIRAAQPPRGLPIHETTETIQVGPIRFRKNGWPLIESCTYGDVESIGEGANGLIVSDLAGRAYDFRQAKELTVEIVKPGPVHVLLRYRGHWLAGEQLIIRFTTEIEMLNSKSLWKVTHTVHDPRGQLSAVRLHTPFRLGALPYVWDFGTGSWTYGALRHADDLAVLEQTVAPSGSRSPEENPWLVSTGRKNHLTPYEIGVGSRARMSEGWGHLTGAQVVAFALGDFGKQPGVYSLSVAGDGAAEFGYRAWKPLETLELTVYQHFVSVPVQIGAATNPPAMISPLVARCRKSYYEHCGVAVPDAAP